MWKTARYIFSANQTMRNITSSNHAWQRNSSLLEMRIGHLQIHLLAQRISDCNDTATMRRRLEIICAANNHTNEIRLLQQVVSTFGPKGVVEHVQCVDQHCLAFGTNDVGPYRSRKATDQSRKQQKSHHIKRRDALQVSLDCVVGDARSHKCYCQRYADHAADHPVTGKPIVVHRAAAKRQRGSDANHCRRQQRQQPAALRLDAHLQSRGRCPKTDRVPSSFAQTRSVRTACRWPDVRYSSS